MDFAPQASRFGTITNAVINNDNVVDKQLPGNQPNSDVSIADFSSEGQKCFLEERIEVAELRRARRAA
jgi:hypothetical protein